jgi:hypothetical protein
MCCNDGQENKYSVLNECSKMLKYNISNGSFPSVFLSTEVSYTYLISLTDATCLTHLLVKTTNRETLLVITFFPFEFLPLSI